MRDYPCSHCHDKVDPAVVAAGTTKKHRMELKHGAAKCVLCHTPEAMDRLRLPAGGTVSFDEVHTMCGQCHHDKLRDWEGGAHGKEVGKWSGIRHRFSCVDCHDPHRPKPPPVKALPGPPFPERGIRKGAH